jgi:hypothetical protein
MVHFAPNKRCDDRKKIESTHARFPCGRLAHHDVEWIDAPTLSLLDCRFNESKFSSLFDLFEQETNGPMSSLPASAASSLPT